VFTSHFHGIAVIIFISAFPSYRLEESVGGFDGVKVWSIIINLIFDFEKNV
jgi:hypothetical protein